MIKIDSVSKQQENASVNVTFDTASGNKNMSFQIGASDLSVMTEKEIKDFLKAKVEEQRADNIDQLIATKFEKLIDVDIEKPEMSIPETPEPSEPIEPVDPDADTKGDKPK